MLHKRFIAEYGKRPVICYKHFDKNLPVSIFAPDFGRTNKKGLILKKFIDKWVSEGLINTEQAGKMISDIENGDDEKSSKRIIFAFSTLGSVLLGVGFILFFAANWQTLPALAKILMLAAFTFGAAFGGYFLKYENKNYPKTGASLIFLSSLLIGALIFLTAQTYHIEASGKLHILILLWLLCVLPYAYIFLSRSSAVLTSVLFLLWFGVFFFKTDYFFNSGNAVASLSCLSGVFLFCFGKGNEFVKDFSKVSAVYEKIGLFIIFLTLFCLTFFKSFYAAEIFQKIPALITAASLLAFILTFFFNPAKKNDACENSVIASIFLFLILSQFLPLSRLVLNLFFFFLLLLLIPAGYRKKEMFYVNLGIFWLIIFIDLKYFDIFWKLLPRSAFFISGGIILMLCAISREKIKKNIKSAL